MIVNYNGGRLVLDCIESIRKFTRDYELLVIDNGSTDGSIEELGELDPDARIIRNHTNLGFAKANNIGMSEAKGKYVALLNPDVVVTKDWLEKLINCMEKAPGIGIATPKLLRFDGRLDSTGHLFQFIRLEAKNRGEEEQDRGQYDSLTELLSCDFACSVIRTDLIDHVGLLDENIFLDHEDLDYCLRARIAGWRVIYCPTSTVYHHRGGVTSGVRKATRQLQARKYLLRLALKSYDPKSIVRVIGYKQRDLLSFTAKLAKAMKKHNVSEIKSSLNEICALLTAFLWNAIHFPTKERVLVQRSRRLNDKELDIISRSSMPK